MVQIQTVEAWREFVRTLPPRSERDYYTQVIEVALVNPLQDVLERELADDESSPDFRFAAFYGLLVRFRREKNFTEFESLVDSYLDEFKDEPVMDVLRAEALAFDSRDKARLAEARRLARRALEKFDRPGARLLNAEICLKLYDAEDQRTRDLISEADDHINIALSGAPGDPKMLALRARIRAHQNRFNEAYSDVFAALDSEDSRREDYAIRVMDHQMSRMEVVLRDYLHRLEDAQSIASEEFGQARRTMLETLGLLAAVIAFLSTTVTVSIQLSLEDAAKYSLISAGTVLLVFIGFSLVISRTQSWIRVAVAGLIALVMVGIPLLQF